MLIIGIDPGKSGGVAVLQAGGTTPLAHKMPETPADLVELLAGIKNGQDESEPVKAYLELVGPRRGYGKDGKNTRSSSREWSFAEGYGVLKGILTALKIPFELVRPQKWQQAMGCMTGGNKNVSKGKAQQLWPDSKWTHAKADAALICEYGRRIENF